MYERTLNIKELAGKKSIFLFGPRSTGKSTLLKTVFEKKQIINLLKSEIFLMLSERPSELRQMVKKIHSSQKNAVIVIDEIQKIPILLDEVHELIESSKVKFVLTGSSARKLKRSGVNLLAGRAWQANMFPLTSREIDHFDIEKYLLYGGLPQVYLSSEPEEELDAYVNTYLKEEVKEEALVQNFINFSRFLKIAALTNSEQLNYAAVSSDSGIPATSVRQYFEILDDTFVGFSLLPWRESKKRKAVSTAKFYFFDVGVANFLAGIKSLNRSSIEYGKCFEHFIAMELRAFLSYSRTKKELTFWRTHTQIEVDFVIGNEFAIEVKSSYKITDKHLKGLRAIIEENKKFKCYVISFDEVERVTPDGIELLHWKAFLQKLWDKSLLT